MLATLANAFLLPMLPEGLEMRCCECDLWWLVPGGGGVLAAEGALDDDTGTVGFGPASEGAVLAETILTAAVSFLVLKTVAVLPLLRLLLRMGALGPDILTVVVMRVVRPPGAGDGDDDDDDDDDDELAAAAAESASACAACVA